ncbi:afadin- and alpha-actinin-binding protein A-like [Uloborus diversus]|uniref:afadin- and alpha-actinin-binding protein A-like n=1 Tax=Uloborus diversus TaxID=327109 RepID=UPI002409B789|nr:afadin- and alpha-actinin-binding protein A-like [Uloborus diversus]
MNKAQSIYKSDYGPYGWSENDYNSVGDDFCSEENIDHCLRYLSQEFGALGYPSIYTNSSSCPYSINCDIVNYINITYDILRNCSEHAKNKEILEDRNRRLSTDLNILGKKNNHLKNNLEQTEKKLACALERERQLKVKVEQITQSLKIEKDEVIFHC